MTHVRSLIVLVDVAIITELSNSSNINAVNAVFLLYPLSWNTG